MHRPVHSGSARMVTMTHCHVDCVELVADCRLRAVTDLLAHKWDAVVLAALRTDPLRRQNLRAAIGAISEKVLTDSLNRLRGNGLIDRRVLPGRPPRVDYALTALGQSLVDGPMQALGAWITAHGDELLAAQENSRDDLASPGSSQFQPSVSEIT